MAVLAAVTIALQPFGITRPGEPHGICHAQAVAVGDGTGGAIIAGFLIGSDNILLKLHKYAIVKTDASVSLLVSTEIPPNLLAPTQYTVDTGLVQTIGSGPGGSTRNVPYREGTPIFLWRETAGTIIQSTWANTATERITVSLEGVYWHMDLVRADEVAPHIH